MELLFFAIAAAVIAACGSGSKAPEKGEKERDNELARSGVRGGRGRRDDGSGEPGEHAEGDREPARVTAKKPKAKPEPKPDPEPATVEEPDEPASDEAQSEK